MNVKLYEGNGSPLNLGYLKTPTTERNICFKSNDHISVTKYADDTAFSCQVSKDSFNNDQLNYQLSVKNIVSVFDRKNLLLNSKKSKQMCFTNV